MGRLLAIDYGEKRLGLAISDPNQIISKPLKTLILSDSKYIYNELEKIISDYEIQKLIIGLPVGMNGKNTQQTRKVEAFREFLQNKIDIPIILFDERLSSVSAKKSLISQGVKTGHNKSKIDQTAAAIFLQHFLDTLNY
ncbi:MAG: Holliday junction resolvase RuvX [Candidatus Marinimicrobia bacterium]|nr:Holliday junction resolvase RuvX [Candidatus Neomarinimicrobiota bacterium]|tara:strand:+ start:503 stop:919 length:417 start_codon:yes stop_codon:yes gene_type:complete